MPTPVVIYGANGKPLRSELDTIEGKGEQVLAITTAQREHSIFVTKSWVGAEANTKIATPRANGTLELLDLVISGSKKAAGTLTIRWNDGTKTDTLFVGSVDDAALNIAVAFTGKVEGWSGAYLEYTIVSAWTGSLLMTYVHHILPGPTYAEWNSRR